MTELLDVATVDLDVLLGELADEQAALRAVVEDAAADVRDRVTPAAGWDVGSQLAHLVQGDELAALAVADPDAFAAALQRLVTGDLEANVEDAMARWRALEQDELLAEWTAAARRLRHVLAGRGATDRVAWVAGRMSLGTFARARLMEAFAHGQDVRDGLDVAPSASDRVRHVAYLGVRTRGFSYTLRGRTAPDVPIRVTLAAPGGDTWTWGPDDATERIEGDAVDFALVVTRRRHPEDTGLDVSGDVAAEWMDLAQCYAGPPTAHRSAGSFPDGWRGAAEEPAWT